MITKLNDRQSWLLIYMLSRHPNAVVSTKAVPYSCDLNGRNYGCPGGIGMGNLRGLQRRGYVKDQGYGLFSLTEEGVLRAQEEADDSRWIG